MEGNSLGKHFSLDSKPVPISPKRPRTSRSNRSKSQEDPKILHNEFQKEKETLSCHFTALQSERTNLLELWNHFEKRYQKLQSFYTAENKPQAIDETYNAKKLKMNGLMERVILIENKVKEIKRKELATRKNIGEALFFQREISKLVEQIKKQINYIKNKTNDFNKKITVQETKFNKSTVKRQTVQGDEFQRLLQVLIRKRALSCDGAEVGVEVSGVGQLDDTVYLKTTEQKCRFFQMKHMNEGRKSIITAKELFKCTFDEDDDDEATNVQNAHQVKGKKKSKEQPGLHLLMYLKSFCQIKENPKFDNFNIDEVTLITNRDIFISDRKKGQELMSLLVLKESDECLDFGSRKAQKYGLNVQEAKIEFFQDLLHESCKCLSKKQNDAESIVEEFLQKIHIVVNYPDIVHLRQLIFNELFDEEVFGPSNMTILGDYMLHFEIQLLQVKNEFTTNEKWQSEINEIKKHINALKSFGISDLNTQTVLAGTSFSIAFENENDILEDLRQLIDKKQHKVLVCMGNNFQMNAMKVMKTLHKRKLDKKCKTSRVLLCEYENLLTANFLQQSFCDGDFDLLVVMCKNVTCEDNTLLTNLVNALENSKMMIIVSDGENTFTDSLKSSLKEKYVSKQYEHGYKYLTVSCKETLNNKQISFQMKTITFSELISDKLAINIVDDNCLWNIINKSNPEIKVSDDSSFCSPGYSKAYYIPRKFYQRTISFKQIQKYLSTNLFLLTGETGITEEQIKKFVSQKNISIDVYQKWEDKTCGICVCDEHTLSSSEIFNNMSSSTKNVHWICMNERNNFFLIYSTVEHFAENEIIDKNPMMITEKSLLKGPLWRGLYSDLARIVILVGDSGVGKSTTLTSIANKIRESCSKTWVARVVLTTTCLKNTNNLVSPDDAISCVCKMIFTSESQNCLDKNLIKEALKRAYNRSFRFVLLLDGFNEINEGLQAKVITLTKTLRDHCNVDQIWITTQNHDRVKLETELKVSSYFLIPLNEEDQINLMALYWQTEYEKKIPTVEIPFNQLCTDAKYAIQQFKTSVNDVEKRLFTENSLNLRMLADVLMDTDRKINETLNIYDLYETFVQKKLSFYRKETTTDRSVLSGQGEIGPIDSIKDKLFENYVRGILQQFSVNNILNNVKTCKGIEKKLPGMDAYETFQAYITSSESEFMLSKLGLLTLKNHTFDFSHPSFAQFFFSEYLLKHLFNCNINLQQLWVQLVLSESSFQPCRRFLDHALSKIEYSNAKELQTLKDNLGKPRTDKLIQKTRNSAAPMKENLYYVSLFVFRWLNKSDKKRYLEKILNQDFKLNDVVLESIDKIITYFDTTPTEQSVQLLISLYQEMNKKEVIQNIVQKLIKPEENHDQKSQYNWSGTSTYMNCKEENHDLESKYACPGPSQKMDYT